MSHILVHTGTVGCVVAINGELIERSKRTVIACIIFVTYYGTILQVLDRLNLRIHITSETGCIRLIVIVRHHQAVWVAIGIIPVAVAGIIKRRIILVVVAIYRRQWRGIEGTAQRVVVSIAHTDTRILGIDETDLLTHLQPVLHLPVGIDTEVVTFIIADVLAANNTLLVHITQRHGIISCLATAIYTYIIRRSLGILHKHLIYPVGINQIAIGIIDTLVFAPVVGVLTRVDGSLIQNSHILPGIEHINAAWLVLPTHIAVEANHGTAFLTTLGSNQNHTIGRLRTIDGSRCRILQHINAFDIGRIQRSDVTTYTINDVKRIRTTHGAHTTDVYLQTGTRLTGCRNDAHTRSLSLERLKRIGSVQLGDVITLHVDIGTRHQLFLLNTITHDDDLIKRLLILIQGYVDYRTCDLHLLGDKAQVRNFECLSILCFNGKVTIQVSNGTRLCTLHHDTCTNQWFIVTARDNSTLNRLSIEDTRSDS